MTWSAICSDSLNMNEYETIALFNLFRRIFWKKNQFEYLFFLFKEIDLKTELLNISLVFLYFKAKQALSTSPLRSLSISE